VDAASVQSWLTGADGTEVGLRLLRGARHASTVVLARAPIAPETVFSTRTAALLVVQVTGFDAGTVRQLMRAITRGLAVRRRPDGIVLDLRGNRGGLLAEAVTSAGLVLSPGVIAITQGRDPAADRIWQAGAGDIALNTPLVVIVDGRTASSAEVLAAALADRGRAVVVGSATFGKGLVQTIDPLPDGGELFVTWSRILAPRGWPVQGLGVVPQVCTSLGEAALGRQLAALADGNQPMAAAIARERDARAPVPAAEAVAIRDACPAAEGGEIDLSAARVLIEDPAAYAAALLPPTTGWPTKLSGER
jgi:carboxyl-terminal processing protease